MADVTPVLGIVKPVFDQAADIRVVNTALDVIDANAGTTNAAIAAGKPMTTLGDLIVGGSSGVPGRLGVGTNGQVLKVSAGLPAWAPDVGFANPLTTPGDLFVGGAAGAPGRLGVGAETQALTVVGGVPAWTPPTYGGMTNPMTAPSDLIVGSTGGGAVRLGKGAEGQVLAVTAGVVGWSAPAAAANELVNPGFEVWARGNGPFATTFGYSADRWQSEIGGGSTLSVARDTANRDAGSVSCAACTHTGAGPSYLRQVVEDYPQLVGRTMTYTARIKTSTANAVRIVLYDAVGGFNYSAYHTGGGAYETLTVTKTITEMVQTLVVFTAPCTAYVDNAVLVVGSSAPPYTPRHPADEAVRCLRYYEVLGSGVFEEPFALGQVRSVAEIRWPLRYAEKAVVPTVTLSAPNHFGAWLADFSSATAFQTLAAQNIGRQQCLMVGTATFTGFVAGQASTIHAFNTAARVRVEANPP